MSKFKRAIAMVLVLAMMGAGLALQPRPVYAQSVSKTLSATTCPGVGCFVIDASGRGTVGVQITGTFVGTLQFEQSIDGTNYKTWTVTPFDGSSTVSAATAVGLWSGSVAVRYVRIRFSAFTSGTAVVSLVSTQARAGGSGGGSGMCVADVCSFSFPSTFTGVSDGVWRFRDSGGNGFTLRVSSTNVMDILNNAASNFGGLNLGSLKIFSTLVAANTGGLAYNAGFGTGAAGVGATTAAWTFTIGTSPATSGVISSLPTAGIGWHVHCDNTTQPDAIVMGQTAWTASTATMKSYSRTTGIAAAPAASDVILCSALGF